MKPARYVVTVTERDLYGNEVKVETKGCRFATGDDGSLTVFDDGDREVGAWAQGYWTRVGTHIETAEGGKT